MHERICVRGCVVKGRHVVPHDVNDSCKGCLPEEATEGFVCTRCARRLRHTITEAPDLCVRIRSSVDPMKAQVYDREKLGGKPSSESRPPMSLDAIAAADEILAILTYSAEEFGDEMRYRLHTFEAGTDSALAYQVAKIPAGYLLEQLDGILNDERVGVFAEAVLGPRPKELVEGEPIEPWSIGRALRRWPDHMPERWAKQPCPGCSARTIRVRPPRMPGDDTEFWCVNEGCPWEVPDNEQAIWSEYFGIRSHEHFWVSLPEAPAGEFRCGCGSSAFERDGEIVVTEEVVA